MVCSTHQFNVSNAIDWRPRADQPVEFSPDYGGSQIALNENVLGKNHAILSMPDRYAIRSFGPLHVLAGQYLMLGDNRDNSVDSRYFGLVKRELITGQVKRVLFSLNNQNYYLPRLDRIAKAL